MWIKVILLVSALVSSAWVLQAQTAAVTLSGVIKNKLNKAAIPFVNIVLVTAKDSGFVTGTVSNEEGRFTLLNVKPGSYILESSYIGFEPKSEPLLIGSLSYNRMQSSCRKLLFLPGKMTLPIKWIEKPIRWQQTLARAAVLCCRP